MPHILVVDSHKPTQKALTELLVDYSITVAPDASRAIELANNTDVDVVILELSLAGHSGMEFLYEFRSYTDWANVPVLIYTRLQLADEVVQSRTWGTLSVTAYLYKPNTSLMTLKQLVEKAAPRS